VRLLLVLVVFAACERKAKEAPPEEDSYCDRDLSEVSGALDAALAAPPDVVGDAFTLATERHARDTVCGPDFAQLVRDWQAYFKARGSDEQRRTLLVRYGDESKRVGSSKWRMPAKLVTAVEQARK
jgi:hypothetical protein